ncbi:MAG: hypothetical protein AAGG51_27535 [Cyanobacteria bacterium P01_G01_bin.54]
MPKWDAPNINFFFLAKDYDPAKENEIMSAARKFIEADKEWSWQAEITFTIYEYGAEKRAIVGIPRYPLGVKIAKFDGWLPDEIRKWQQAIYEANGAECKATIDWDSDDEPCMAIDDFARSMIRQ